MKIRTFSLILFLIINSCSGSSPVAPNPENINSPQQVGAPPIVSKNPVTYFNNQLISQGINLTKDEVGVLKQYIESRPDGRWAYSETDSSKSSLEKNFESYKNTFTSVPKDEFEYMNRAIQFSNSGNLYSKYYFDTNYYKNRKKILVIKWDTQTKEFIIIHIDGRISSYQFAENINPPRYILVPESI